MNRLLTVFGLAIPVVILVIAIFYGLVIYKGSHANDESEAFVNTVVPVVLAAMNRETFFKYADDTLINSATPDRFDRIFTWFSTLGAMQKYNGSSGQANVNLGFSGISFSADYEARATFDKGDAVVKVSAVRRNGNWKITGFGISSPALTQTSNDNLYKL